MRVQHTRRGFQLARHQAPHRHPSPHEVDEKDIPHGIFTLHRSIAARSTQPPLANVRKGDARTNGVGCYTLVARISTRATATRWPPRWPPCPALSSGLRTCTIPSRLRTVVEQVRRARSRTHNDSVAVARRARSAPSRPLQTTTLTASRPRDAATPRPDARLSSPSRRSPPRRQ